MNKTNLSVRKMVLLLSVTAILPSCLDAAKVDPFPDSGTNSTDSESGSNGIGSGSDEPSPSGQSTSSTATEDTSEPTASSTSEDTSESYTSSTSEDTTEPTAPSTYPDSSNTDTTQTNATSSIASSTDDTDTSATSPNDSNTDATETDTTSSDGSDTVTEEVDTVCANGCFIDDHCFTAGDPNPDASCEHCDIAISIDQWSPNTGAVCDDGVYCNGLDHCESGQCIQHDGTPCSSEQSCLEEAEICCTPGACVGDLTCNVAGNVVCTDECGDTLQVEECVSPDQNGLCDDGACGCAEGYGGDDCQSCAETNGGVESCDGVDNDCDGQTDENFNFNVDPDHCGGCGNDCLTMPSLWPDFGGQVPANLSEAICNGGYCEVSVCEPGFRDDVAFPYEDCRFHIQEVSAGGNHTCALLSNSVIKCWGNNFFGQLGVEENTNINQANPTPVTVNLSLSTGVRVHKIAVGNGHTCAALTNETALCWGNNQGGQLGNEENCGTLMWNPEPLLVGLPTGRGVEDIGAGNLFTCALLDDNTVWCWGRNNNGQLGDEETAGSSYEYPNPSIVPLDTSGGKTIQSIAVAGSHACALFSNNTIACWGANGSGQLGNEEGAGTMPDRHPIPLPVDLSVPGGVTIQSIAAGANHTCAALSNGRIRCWGNNSQGQLGTDTSESWTLSPVEVSYAPMSGTTVLQISLGNGHTCASYSNEVSRCWGANSDGELGTETAETITETPVTPGLPNGIWARGISAGYDHTCAHLSDVAIRCWGYNYDGQLGTILPGEETEITTPTAVDGLY